MLATATFVATMSFVAPVQGAELSEADKTKSTNTLTYVAEPLHELPTVLRANSGLGEMAEPLQSLPTVLRANSGLDEVAQPQQSSLGLAGLDYSLLSKAEPQQNNISSPVGEDKGGVHTGTYDFLTTPSQPSMLYETAPAGEVAQSAEGEFLIQNHPTGISKLTGSLRNSVLPVKGGVQASVLSVNGGVITGGAAPADSPTGHVKWTESGSAASDFNFNSKTGVGTGTVAVNESEAVKYYTYTYTRPAGGLDEGTGNAKKYYKWQVDASGNRTLVEGTASDYDVIANYNNANAVTTRMENPTSGYSGVNFIGAHLDASGNGGALSFTTSGDKGDIVADFVGNYINANGINTRGGAIENTGAGANITSITGDFIGNYISGTSSSRNYGGAISNSTATIGNITGDFIGNYISDTSSYHNYGGAISNYANGTNLSATINSITGDFIGNYISGTNGIFGGAISNDAQNTNASATIGDITGDFIGNYIKASSGINYGGAIYNYAYGIGATATIGNITGDFIGNYINATAGYIQGGAIYNYASGTNTSATITSITSITGDFIGNYITGTDQNYGGAIANYSQDYGVAKTGIIKGDFINNSVTSTDGTAYGGAVYNSSAVIDNIADRQTFIITKHIAINGTTGETVEYWRNSAKTSMENYLAAGKKLVVSYSTSLKTNQSESQWQTILDNITSGTYLTSDPTNALTPENIWTPEFSSENAMSVNGDFIGNSVSGTTEAKGGAVFNFNGMVVNDDDKYSVSVRKYVATRAETGETITYWYGSTKNNIDYNLSKGKKLVVTNSTYEQPNQSESQWTSLLNDIASGYYVTTDPESGLTPEDYWTAEYGGATIALSGDFIGNSATATTGTAQGGAIYNSGVMTLKADTRDMLFKDNKTIVGTTETLNDIHNGGTVNMLASEGHSITFGGTITDSATPKGTINIGDSTHKGTVAFNNTVTQKAINLNGGTIHLNSDDALHVGTFTNNGCTLDLITDAIETQSLGNLVLNNDLSLALDANASNGTIDTLTATSVTANGKNLVLDKINIYADGDNLSMTISSNPDLQAIIKLAAEPVVSGTTHSYTAVYNSANGVITFTQGDLNLAGTVQATEPLERTYDMARDEEVLTNLGTIGGGDGAKVTVNTNGYNVIGNGNAGVVIDSNQTLEINGAGTWSGFESDNGGVIYNSGTMTLDSSADGINFTNNSVTDTYGAFGGAIYNEGTIGDIYADFTSNHADSVGGSYAYGGAIYNCSDINSIIGNYTGNYTTNNNYDSYGGAIYNEGGSIGSITGNFVNNHALNFSGDSYGGAIFNSGDITTISGDFRENYAQSTGAYAYGGAISTGYAIESITGNFIGNYTKSDNDSSKGGAIYNTDTLGSLTATFTDNFAKSENSDARGGAILNSGTTGSIDGTFKNNYAASTSGSAYGGAISTEMSEIDSISGDYIGNYAASTSGSAYGGAIYNEYGTTKIIGGNFTNNSATGASAGGGAIYNADTIASDDMSDVTAMRITQHIAVKDGTTTSTTYYDPADLAALQAAAAEGKKLRINTIVSKQTLSETDYQTLVDAIAADTEQTTYLTKNPRLDADVVAATYRPTQGGIKNATFDGNSVTVTGDNVIGEQAGGGAIYNAAGGVMNFDGKQVFKNNTVTSTGTASVYGGAIYNEGVMGDIEGEFVGNSVSPTSAQANGGAIYNAGVITQIKGEFSDNNLVVPDFYSAGAGIYLSGYTNSISGVFKNNSITSNIYAKGAAIHTRDTATLNIINADFINNYIKTTTTLASINATEGGALWLYNALVSEINGDFTGNYAQAIRGAAGGAIYTNANIGSISSNFVDNYAKSDDSYARGGAIYNNGRDITSIQGSFANNSVTSTTNIVQGGAIYNNGTIGSITGDFINNRAESTSGTAQGGAIYNAGTIGDITGNFSNNKISGSNNCGGAIYNAGTIGDITGNFSNNVISYFGSLGYGGAIYNSSQIGHIKGNFIGNGTTYDEENLSGDYTYGGAIYNSDGTIAGIEGDFSNNFAKAYSHEAYGGAIYNEGGTIDAITGDFINNRAESTSGTAQGGAIFNAGTMRLVAGDRDILFKDNKTIRGGVETYNDIYSSGALFLNAATGHDITFNGTVESTGTVHHGASSDPTTQPTGGKYVYNNAVNVGTFAFGSGAKVRFGSTRQSDGTVTYGTLTANSTGFENTNYAGYIDTQNAHNDTYNMGSVASNSTIHFNLDANTSSGTADVFNTTNTPSANSLIIDNINIYTVGSNNTVTVANANSKGAFALNSNINQYDDANHIYHIVGADNYRYTATYNASTGQVTFTKGTIAKNLAYYVANSENWENATYTMSQDEQVLSDLWKMGGNNYALTIEGNGNTILAHGNIRGIRTGKSGQSLTMRNVTVEGFNNDSGGYTPFVLVSGSTGNFENVKFINNIAPRTVGGAIYNAGTITNLDADFINNLAGKQGGAVTNFGEISSVTGIYYLNSVQTSSTGLVNALGGGIYVSLGGHIGSIDAVFENNYVKSPNSFAQGGAIYNDGTIASIGNADDRAQFNYNYVEGKSYTDPDTGVTKNTSGGAIYNSGTIDDIYADFTGNYAKSESGAAYGGAIYNAGTIDSISGDFIGNYISGRGYGGAISNTGAIGSINGDFAGNSAISESGIAQGGVIHNNAGTIDTINSKFSNNALKGNSASGGVILNAAGGVIGSIDGIFDNNTLTGTGNASLTPYANGILHNLADSTINSINADFTNNTINAYSRTIGSGILNENSTIGSISGNFKNNSSTSTASYAIGGAIANSASTATIDTIVNSTFTNNYVKGKNVGTNYTGGGAIYNAGTIDDIHADFTGNYAESADGSAVYGGAIYNKGGTITNVTGTFSGNETKNEIAVNDEYKGYGGAIANIGGTVTITDSTFTDNIAARDGGAIYNDGGGTITVKNSLIESNTANFGSAFYNKYTLNTLNLYDVTVKNNTATDANSGSALYNNYETNVFAQNGNTEFAGNLREATGEYVDVLNLSYQDKALNLNAGLGHEIRFGGAIDGRANEVGKIVINNDANIKGGKVLFGGDVRNNTLNFYNNGTIVLAKAIDGAITPSQSSQSGSTTTYGSLNLTGLTNDANGGFVDARNEHFGDTINLGAVTLNSDLNIGVDANGVTGEGDITHVSSITPNGHKLLISAINLVADGTTAVQVADSSTYNDMNVSDKLLITGNLKQGALTTATYTPSGDAGYLNITTTDGYNLSRAVLDTTPVRAYAMSGDEDVTSQRPLGNLGGKALSIVTNGYNVDGKGLGGITVRDGQSLSITGGGMWKNFNISDAVIDISVGKVENIAVDFVDNENRAIYLGSGGYTEIGTIDSNFVNNKGAICTSASVGGIGNIVGSFVSNSDYSAVYNIDTQIGTITGKDYELDGVGTVNGFYGNSATANNDYAYGGAIYNKGTIGDILADFISNSVTSASGEASGGAIYNYGSSASIGDITGDFTNNSATATTNGNAYGGAIYNYGSSASIGDITGDFTNNSATADNNSAYGGAIYNQGTIGNITGNFTSNTTSAHGGAICNDNNGTIDDITGNFISNTISYDGSMGYGGAINNGGAIGSIDGNFVSNGITALEGAYEGTNPSGGAITNYENIGSIDGSFVNNYINANSTVYGGAIYNSGTIDRITGKDYELDGVGTVNGFYGNSATSADYEVYGGAIYNYGSSASIGDITGDFTNNSATSTNNYAYGGAIYNNGYYNISSIGDITGDFTNNSATSTNSYAYGGAISNYADGSNSSATIGDITGDFTENKVTSANYGAYGGAIYNYAYSSDSSATIGNITGDFSSNKAEGYDSSAGYVAGGAIYNYGSSASIGDITGDFKNNIAKNNNTSGYAYGGAIYNSYGAIGDITGDFTDNSAVGGYAYGGAIYNTGIIGKITGTEYSIVVNNETVTGNGFYGNTATATDGSAFGGAIYNEGTIGDITITSDNADYVGFVNNSVTSTSGNAQGGAIYNEGTITDILADFTNNSATATTGTAQGGAIDNAGTMHITDSNFSGNYATAENGSAQGGAIFNSNKMIVNNSTFDGNIAGNDGGAVAASGGNLLITDSVFQNNVAQNGDGGAILLSGGANVVVKNSDFVGNSAYNWGGAIYLNGTSSKLTLIDSDFSGNNVDRQVNPIARGAGIRLQPNDTVNIIADSKNVEFKNNYTGGNYSDIYSFGTINLNAASGKNITFGGALQTSGTINIGKSDLTYTTLNDDYTTSDVNITQTGGTYNFGDSISGSNLAFNLYNGAKVNLGTAINGVYIDELSLRGANGLATKQSSLLSTLDNQENGLPQAVAFAMTAVSNGTGTMADLVSAAQNAGMAVNYGALNVGSGGLTNDANGGVINAVNNYLNGMNLGNVTLGSDLHFLLDGSTKVAAGNTTGMGDVLNGTSITDNGHNLVIDKINLYEFGKSDRIHVADDNLKASVTYAGGTIKAVDGSKIINYSGSTYDAATGDIVLTNSGYKLPDAVADATLARTYVVLEDETVDRNLGAMNGGDGAILNIIGQNFTIDGDGHSGIVVDTAQNLNIKGGKWTGFSKSETVSNPTEASSANPYIFEGGTILKIADGATVNIKDSAEFSNNSYTYTISKSSSGDKAYGHMYGGIISNEGTIKGIDADIINNSVAQNSTNYVYNYLYGGLISNKGTIGDINGKINSNTITNTETGSASSYFYGALIANLASTAGTTEIGDINGEISNNNINVNEARYKGGIYNYASVADSTAKIGDINAKFTGNTIAATSSIIEGGYIYNDTKVDEATAEIGDINGEISNNSVTSNSGFIWGGLITNNYAKIGKITSDFKNNTTRTSFDIIGSLIYSDHSSIDEISGDIKNNTASGSIKSFSGIENRAGYIGLISGEISGNTANLTKADSQIYGFIKNLGNSTTKSTIAKITSDFSNNSFASVGAATGGTIMNSTNSEITEGIIGDFTNNSIISTGTGALARAGAIYNIGSISTITARNTGFIGNYAQSSGTGAYGGAIQNVSDGVIGNILADFTNNYAIATGENGSGQGGAIWNSGTVTLTDNTFTGNAATTLGGAIFNSGMATIVADTKNVNFSGNKVGVEPIIDSETGKITGVTGGTLNDIHNTGTLNLLANDGRAINFTGSITDDETPTGTISIGDAEHTGLVDFGSTIKADSLNLNSGTMHLDANDALNIGTITAEGGTLDLITDAIETQSLGNFVLNNDLTLALDANLHGTTAIDTLTATTFTNNGSSLLFDTISLITDEFGTTRVHVTDNADFISAYGLSDAIKVVSPNLYDYTVTWDSENGDLVFNNAIVLGNTTLDRLYKEGTVPNPSVYELTEATATDYNILSHHGPEHDGELLPYNFEFRTKLMRTSRNIRWERDTEATEAKPLDFDPTTGVGTGTIAVQIPHTVVNGDTVDTTPETRYYTYTYTHAPLVYGTGDGTLTIALPESLGTDKSATYKYQTTYGDGNGTLTFALPEFL